MDDERSTPGLGPAVAEHEHRLLTELATGTALSAAVGGAAWAVGRTTGRSAVAGFGRQTLAWVAVDAALAAGGLLAERRRSGVDDPPARARLLHRVLRVNAVLDVGYVLGGALWAWRRPERRGDGAAVMVQGAFLLWLDSRHAGRVGALLSEG